MMKKAGIIRRKIAVLLIVALSINSFGAVVSDNDGSAFITKAEFDSLKNNFQSQIDNYNQSIDSKIDGAIASYLSGIQISSTLHVEGGFADFAQLKFYNKLGIPAWTYNSGCGDNRALSCSGNKPMHGTYFHTVTCGPQGSPSYKTYTFDFYGQDATMAKVARRAIDTSTAGFDYYGAAYDQMAVGGAWAHQKETEPNIYTIDGGYSLLEKIGHYGYFGARRGWSGDHDSHSCPMGIAIGDKGYTSLAGFAEDSANKDTVKWLRAGANWIWDYAQPDCTKNAIWVKDATKPYSSDNLFSGRIGSGDWKFVPSSDNYRWRSVTPPAGYAFAMQGKYGRKQGAGTINPDNQLFGFLIPDAALTLQSILISWYNLDPSADYRLDPSNTDSSLWNYKADVAMIAPLQGDNGKIFVDDVLLAFDDSQDLYVSKYGVKNDVWPLHTTDIVTGNVDIFDDNMEWMGRIGNSDVLSTLGPFEGWDPDTHGPDLPALHTGPSFSLRLPSYQKFDHLHNYLNYKSVMANDPLQINGGIRIGKFTENGTVTFNLKISRSSGSPTTCKVYIKKSSFDNAVPTAAQCVSGTYNGSSGALCGVSPDASGNLTVSFPVLKNEEAWIMVSPESRPARSVLQTDTASYAYAQLIQCDGQLVKDN